MHLQLYHYPNGKKEESGERKGTRHPYPIRSPFQYMCNFEGDHHDTRFVTCHGLTPPSNKTRKNNNLKNREREPNFRFYLFIYFFLGNGNVYTNFFSSLLHYLLLCKDLVKASTICCRYESAGHAFVVTPNNSSQRESPKQTKSQR